MRTGLLTRFWAMLGLALGVGLMLAGWWARPLPPAWAAGEAIPWPGREDVGPPPTEGGPPGTVEGSGREIAEQPFPEDDGAGEAQPGTTQGQRRKKRKRRK